MPLSVAVRDDIGWGLDYAFLRQFGWEEVPHKKFLNDYFTGKFPGSPSCGELYNDDPRLGDARLCGTTASLCGIEAAEEKKNKAALEKAVRLDLMLHAFMFTLSGVPVLYSGDEIAQKSDNAYHDDPLKAEDSRYLHRGDLDWKRAAQRTKKNTVPGQVFSGIRLLEGIREEHIVFDDSADTWVLQTGNDHVLGIGRYARGEKLLALFNFADDEQTAFVNDPTMFTDLIDGKEQPAGNVALPACGFKWLLQKMKTK